jgi:Tfp pilus assembly protein PilO
MNDVLKQRLRMVNYSGIAAVVLLLTATAALGIYPMVQRGVESNRAIRDIEAQQADLGTLDQTLLDARKAMNEAEHRLQTREAQLPAAAETNFYDKELTKLIAADGIRKISADTPKDLQDYDGYKVGVIDISGTGDWNSICRFLNDIRKMPGLTRLDAITIDVLRENSTASYDKPLCQFRISFSTFFTVR